MIPTISGEYLNALPMSPLIRYGTYRPKHDRENLEEEKETH
jgi:hypothetical protein